MARIIRIFTDGSAIGNPGPGGWAAIILAGRQRYEFSGSEWCTTIQEMELFAAIQALSNVPIGSMVQLHSDSDFLIRGMRTLVFRWLDQGWKNRQGAKIQTEEHWKTLLSLNRVLSVDWRWIKGHAGHPEQTRADALAYRAARSVWAARRAA